MPTSQHQSKDLAAKSNIEMFSDVFFSFLEKQPCPGLETKTIEVNNPYHPPLESHTTLEFHDP